jgi:hypothetical protein
MQSALDHLQGRTNGRIWRLATLGHLEVLSSYQKLDPCHLPAALPSKGDARFVNVFIRRVERCESIRNPPYKVRRQPGMLAFNM